MVRKPPGWKNEPQRHSLSARGIKSSGTMQRSRGIPMASNYEQETGEHAIEIAQSFVDAVLSITGNLRRDKAIVIIRNKDKLRSYLKFAYDYNFDHDEIEELHGVVIDMYGETLSNHNYPGRYSKR